MFGGVPPFCGLFYTTINQQTVGVSFELKMPVEKTKVCRQASTTSGSSNAASGKKRKKKKKTETAVATEVSGTKLASGAEKKDKERSSRLRSEASMFGLKTCKVAFFTPFVLRCSCQSLRRQMHCEERGHKPFFHSDWFSYRWGEMQ